MAQKLLIAVVAVLALWAQVALSRAPVYDVNLVPEHCKQAPPVDANYTPVGTFETIGNLTVYGTGNRNSRRVLIDVYDIFAYTTNTLQVADLIANEGNFWIVVPDFFHNSTFRTAEGKVMPSNPQVIADFLETRGAWEDTVRADVLTVVQYYKEQGVNEFGIFGFCWGGKITVQALSDGITDLKVGAIVHPASVTNEEANGILAPLYLMPSRNEPDMLPFYEVLVDKFGEGNAGHTRFDNMNHGFSGARGNFSDPDNRAAVAVVIDNIVTFFNGQLDRQ